MLLAVKHLKCHLALSALLIVQVAAAQLRSWNDPALTYTIKKQIVQLNDKRMFICTDKGLLHYNGIGWNHIATSRGPIVQSTSTLFQDGRGNYWVGYLWNGLEVYSPEWNPLPIYNARGEEIVYQQSEVNQFLQVGEYIYAATGEGIVIFRTTPNISIIDTIQIQAYYPELREANNKSNLVRVLRRDVFQPYLLWTGSMQGLFSYNTQTGEVKHYQMPAEMLLGMLPVAQPRPPNNYLIVDIVDQGSYLMCSTWGGGMMIFYKTAKRWEQYAEEPYENTDPLDENILLELVPLDPEHIFVNDFRTNQPKCFHAITHTFSDWRTCIDTEADLSELQNIRYVFVDQDKNFWIGAYDQLYALVPHYQEINQPFIYKIETKDTALHLLESRGDDIHTLDLLDDNRSVRIFISDKRYLMPENLTFQFKMEGADKEWHTGQTAWYGDLSGGNYVFRYKVTNPQHGITEGAPLYIKVELKLWETIWLRLLIAGLLLTGGLCLGYILLSKRQKQREEVLKMQTRLEELKLIALRSQMNPHFLFNSLNTIKSFIAKSNPREATDFINLFSKLIRRILNNTATPTITLEEELETCRLYLELERIRLGGKMDYQIDVEPDIPVNSIVIQPMLFQPFLENAVWHGIVHKPTPGNIAMTVQLLGNLLECVIRDDGVGRTASRKTDNERQKSFGIAITRERLASGYGQHSSVSIIDLQDDAGQPAGTEVTIKIELEHERHHKAGHR